MEKADILEMTVAYLQTIYHRPPPTSPNSGTSDAVGGGRYAAGYRRCAIEVARYLAGVTSTSGAIDAMQLKLMRHLTAVLQTKLLRQPDEKDQLCQVTTSFPEPEVGTRSWNSSDSVCDDRGRTGSPVSSARSETGTDTDDVASISPSSLEVVDPAVVLSSASTSPSCRDRVMVGQLAVGSRSSADRDGTSKVPASNASAADLDLRSADCCIWRPF